MAFAALARDGIAQGVVDAGIDIEMAYDTLVGTSFYIVHVLQPDSTEAAVDRLCSLLLRRASKRKKVQR